VDRQPGSGHWRHLAEVDSAIVVPAAELALLRSLSIFAPLPAPVIERLATNLVALEVAAGTVIIRQGDPGVRFYVVAEGEVLVSIDDEPVRQLGAGAYVGEIALLRDVPRTATVRAQSKVRLYALDRDDFLEAVTGNPTSAKMTEAVVRDRLSRGPS
jgi:CRP-like cAMP-binding protein